MSMKYRVLGSTGLRVSVIGVGTWQFGGEWGKSFSQEEVSAILRRAQELGINLLDTAECYGDHLSERLIGAAIAGRREKWIVATKFGHRFMGLLQRSDERSADDVRRQLEDSLAALKTDYLDLYQFHSLRDGEFFDEGVWRVLEEAKRAGKIRHIGNSIASKIEPNPQAEASKRLGVEVLQVVYNRLDRRPEEKVFPIARRENLGILARVPLASGFLTGKYRPGARFPPGDQRHEMKPQEIDAKLREAEEISKSEVPEGTEMAQWALAWCLKDPVVSSVIPGCKNVRQVEANAKAGELVEG